VEAQEAVVEQQREHLAQVVRLLLQHLLTGHLHYKVVQGRRVRLPLPLRVVMGLVGFKRVPVVVVVVE
jgi:hypothetical protein